ncbi:MAG: hypothetical protein K9L68_08155 [Spirochaetales bacterium]|nr:hypothetical protein [Spirochaetales bacterium]
MAVDIQDSRNSSAKTVLLVTGESTAADSGAEMLEEYGFVIRTVGDDTEAIKTLRENPVHLILLDIDLETGKRDITETARSLLEEYKIPVVLYSGRITPGIIERLQDASGVSQTQKRLQERVKELNCLYKIGEIVERPGISLEEIVRETAKIIPQSWQYPEATGCRIRFGGNEYTSEGFKECSRMQKRPLLVNSKEAGSIEVHVSDEIPVSEKTPFLEEEELLLNAVSERLGSIIERKQNERNLQQTLEEKDYLMKEIIHRVKNNLNMVTSLIQLKDKILGKEVDLSDITHQINAIRIVHEKLYKTEEIDTINVRDYVNELLHTIFSSFTEKYINLKSEIADITLDTKTAIPLGLIINEVATNAIKYGFDTGAEPVFSVTLKENTDQELYILTLSNNGRPFPEDIDLNNPNTLGLQLISVLTSQIKGNLELERAPHPVFTIRFPKE